MGEGKRICELGCNDCPAGMVEEILMNCCLEELSPVEKGVLTCRFRGGKEVAATYDAENNCIRCQPPKDWENKEFDFEVYAGGDKVVCDKSCKAKTTLSCCDKKCDAYKTESQETEGDAPTGSIIKSLGFIDRYLYVWIFLAMGLGVLLGNFVDGIQDAFDGVKIEGVSLPIALGLWLMMWPVLCKVRYEVLHEILTERGMLKHLGLSAVLNWVVGPWLMTGLAWATLPDLDGYRNGVIMVGLARCIAMVLIWNQLAKGDAELCAILVALNSVLQMVLYSPYSLFFLKVVSNQYQDGAVTVDFWTVCKSVLLFLGVPLVAGIITRYTLIALKGSEWFNKKFLPYFGPLALVGLLFTIVVMFSLQGERVIDEIGSVCRVAVPMLLYFTIMWFSTWAISWKMGATYEYTVTQAFTASSNNFELAIAVAVATFGIESQEALAATVGPLIEVPALLGLVYVALWLKPRMTWAAQVTEAK